MSQVVGALHDNLPTRQQIAIKVIASGAGSVMTGLVLTPLQVVKVRWQILTPATGSATLSSLVSSIYKAEGALAFWRGLRTSLCMVAPSTALFMVSYEVSKGILHHEVPIRAAFMTPVVASSFGRIITGTTFAPLEVIRTNQAAGRGGTTIVTTFRSIVSNSGWRGLYTGLLPTLYRDVPFSSVYWLTLEHGKVYLRDSGFHIMRAPPLGCHREDYSPDDPRNQMQPSSVAIFLAAAGGGILASIVTHPFDTIKTRLQVAVSVKARPDQPAPTWLSVLQEMKFGIFYRGLGLRLMTTIPGTSVMMTTYSLVKRMLGEPV